MIKDHEAQDHEVQEGIRRKLEEMNLLDDFLFTTIVSDADVGEEFSKILIKTICGRAVNHLKVTAQKVYYGGDTHLHGVRLDVYLEELPEENTENAVIFNMEAEQNTHNDKIKYLPQRVRFYHSKIDGKHLKAGDSYDRLKNVFVIMIMSKDPFEMGHMIYTIRNQCVEVPELSYEDGARTIFLYTKGTKGNSPKALAELLRYMEHTTSENAVNEDLETLQNMVVAVKQKEEVSLNYMWAFERDRELIEEGEARGKSIERINMILSFSEKFSKEDIASCAGEPVEKIQKICSLKEAHPDADGKAIYKILQNDTDKREKTGDTGI